MQAIISSTVILLAGIVTLLGAYLQTRQIKLKVQQRITMIARADGLNAPVTDIGKIRDGILKHADVLVRQIFALGTSRRWGMHSGSGKLLLLAAASACCIWFVVGYFLGAHYIVTVILCFLAAFFLPHRTLMKEQQKAERKFNEQFPDAVESVARILRAGLPATAAIRMVGEEAQEPVRGVFRTISDQMAIGISLGEALGASSEKIALSDFRFFTVSVNLQYATGGNLVFTLETLAGIIRKRRAIRARARALTSEIRLSAYVLGSLPFLTVGALLLIQPDYLTPLIHDPRGHFVLGLAAGGLLLSVITMKKMMGSVTNE